MTATRADIIADALGKLRVLGAGREPAAEDSEIVGAKLDRIYARLRAKGLTNDGSGVWDLTAVPDEFAEQLVVMTAYQAADDFHVEESRVVRLRLEENDARDDLQRISSQPRSHNPVKTEYF